MSKTSHSTENYFHFLELMKMALKAVYGWFAKNVVTIIIIYWFSEYLFFEYLKWTVNSTDSG